MLVLASTLGVLGVMAGGALITRRQITIVSVTGQSMEPTLAAGDRVVVRRARLRSVHTGQLVVFEAPTNETGGWTTEPPGRDLHRFWLIKRAAAVPGDPVPDGLPDALAGVATVPAGQLVVLGDNPARSIDSRLLGYIPGERLLGVVICSLPRGAPPPRWPAIASPAASPAIPRPAA